MKVNKPRIEAMTDKQLVEFLNFNKPVYQLDGKDYLIATLASRLHSTIDLVDDDSAELFEKLVDTRRILKETQASLAEARQLLNEHKLEQTLDFSNF